jgi:hypothetical protein
MALLTTPAARLNALTNLLSAEGDIAQRRFTTVNDRAAAFVAAMFDLGHTAEYFDSNTVRVDGLTICRATRSDYWSYDIIASDRATVLADRDAKWAAERQAAERRLQARDAATEAWSNEAGAPNAQRAVRNVLRTLGCVVSFVCDCDCRVTFDDGSTIDLDIDPNIDGFDYEGSTDDAECVQGWADAAAAAAHASAATLQSVDPALSRHLNDAVATFGALVRIKALADDACASISAAIIATQTARTQSWNAAALNASAQCALITLECLAAVTECAAKRAAGDAAATQAAAAKDAAANA